MVLPAKNFLLKPLGSFKTIASSMIFPTITQLSAEFIFGLIWYHVLNPATHHKLCYINFIKNSWTLWIQWIPKHQVQYIIFLKYGETHTILQGMGATASLLSTEEVHLTNLAEVVNQQLHYCCMIPGFQAVLRQTWLVLRLEIKKKKTNSLIKQLWSELTPTWH